MESAKSRFLRYVTYYTTSDEFTGTSALYGAAEGPRPRADAGA